MEGGDNRVKSLLVCTQCGFTHAEFLARGLLGCPACYENFDVQGDEPSGDALRADLLHMHPDLHKRPPVPPHLVRAPGPAPEDAAALRERLGDALRHERYEEAAELRRRLDQRGGLTA
jgi:protein arginine kinase activator